MNTKFYYGIALIGIAAGMIFSIIRGSVSPEAIIITNLLLFISITGIYNIIEGGEE